MGTDSLLLLWPVAREQFRRCTLQANSWLGFHWLTGDVLFYFIEELPYGVKRCSKDEVSYNSLL